MTWIKPSFLWLMHRSNWANKTNQTRILAVRISREGWESALEQGVLTSNRAQSTDAGLEQAAVHLQWDPDRSIRGAALDHYAIQVGIGRSVIDEFCDHWTVSIEDKTATATAIRDAMLKGRLREAKRKLPQERTYPLPSALADSLRVRN